MKALLIYTGHLRSWDRCKDNQEKMIRGADIDRFFHTYENPLLPDKFTQIPGEFYAIWDHPYNGNKRPETSVANTFNQWHNNFVGFCLADRGYDVYVRIRPDITFSAPIHLNQYDYAGMNIYIPHGHNYYGGVNDQIAWGSYEVMRRYYSVYLNHPEIFRSGIQFHTETYVTENLKRQGVNVVRVPVDNFIIR